MMYKRISYRGIIHYQNKILLVQHKKNSHWSLPGGKLEKGEDINKCIVREITEELDTAPLVGPLVFINQYIFENEKSKNQYGLDFIYRIENGENFYNSDVSNATHAHEIYDYHRYKSTELIKINMLPTKIIAQLHNQITDHKPLCKIPSIQD